MVVGVGHHPDHYRLLVWFLASLSGRDIPDRHGIACHIGGNVLGRWKK